MPQQKSPKKITADTVQVVSHPDFMPPSNAELEQAVLGSMTIDSDACLLVAPILRPSDFYFEKHRWIYEAILGLWQRKSPVDFLTVLNELEQQGRLSDIGGPAYLTALINCVPTAMHAEAYARTVRGLSMRRQLIHISTEIAAMGYEGSGTVEELLAQAGGKLAALSGVFMPGGSVAIGQTVERTLDRIEAAQQSPNLIWGIPTGFDIDRVTGGLHRQELFVLAGDPGTGKTSFLLDVAVNAARHAKARILLFSFEMSLNELGMRWVSNRANVNSQELKRGYADSEALKRVADQAGILSELPIRIYDMPTDVAGIEARIAREQLTHGVDLVMVDYSRLVLDKHENESLRLASISTGLRAALKRFNVAGVMVHPSSRAPAQQNRQPTLNDLGWSAGVGFDGDTVVFLWKNPTLPANSLEAQAVIVKNRNGATLPVDLVFDGTFTRWGNPIPLNP